MPLPKALLDSIKANLKDGASLPDGLDDLVVFNNEGEFMSTVDKKSKAKMGDAERAAEKRVKDAQTAVWAEVFEKIGITDPDQVDEIKTKLAKAGEVVTELDKQKADNAKLARDTAKEIKRLSEENAALAGFKTTVIKTTALTPHLTKVQPDARDMVTELLLAKLVIDDKGAVTAPEGKPLADYVDDLVKAKPFLKASDYRDGAGTRPGGDKTTGKPNGANAAGGDSAGAAGSGNGTNGAGGDQPKTIAEAVAAAMAAQAQSQSGAGP